MIPLFRKEESFVTDFEFQTTFLLDTFFLFFFFCFIERERYLRYFFYFPVILSISVFRTWKIVERFSSPKRERNSRQENFLDQNHVERRVCKSSKETGRRINEKQLGGDEMLIERVVNFEWSRFKKRKKGTWRPWSIEIGSSLPMKWIWRWIMRGRCSGTRF